MAITTRAVKGSALTHTELDANFTSMFPVGAIYLTTVSTNPGTFLGFGTWTQISKGRTLIGEGTGTGLTARTAGTEIGQEDAINVSHTHTVTDPGHNHQLKAGAIAGSQAINPNTTTLDATSVGSDGYTYSNTTGISVDSAGSSGTDKNIQPSLVVYIWERTA